MPEMFKRDQEYWVGRQNDIKQFGFKKADDLEKLTLTQYQAMNRELKKELEKFYKKYFSGGDFKPSVNAKVSVTQLDKLKKAYKSLSDKYKLPQKDLLGSLKLNKELQQIDLFIHNFNIKNAIPQTDLNIDQLGDMLKDTYTDNYYKTIYMIQKGTNIMGAFNKVNLRAVEKLVYKEFNGAMFVDRFMINKDKMIKTMKEELLNVVTNNKTKSKAIKDMSYRTKVNYSDCKRLIQTEQARLMEECSQDGYIETDVERFQFIATLDKRTSQICRDHDTKIYLTKNKNIGVNCPPLHPNCRSTTVPYFEGDIIEERMGRNLQNGKSEYMPSNIKTYDDWAEYQGLKKDSKGRWV